LYSSSFNPIFNSLNNKYFTFPDLLNKGTAQIKILKNNSSNNPLIPTDLTVRKIATSGHTITQNLPTRATAMLNKETNKKVVNNKDNVSTIKLSLPNLVTETIKENNSNP